MLCFSIHFRDHFQSHFRMHTVPATEHPVKMVMTEGGLSLMWTNVLHQPNLVSKYRSILHDIVLRLLRVILVLAAVSLS